MPATASVQVRTLFSPFDDTEGEFLKFINSAQHSVYCVIYGYHLPRLSDALIAKHAAGLSVNLILDHSQERGRAEQQEVQRLVNAGMGLLVGTSPVVGNIIHSKFTVIDEQSVEFGSWNYSTSASKQSNTVSIIQDKTYARAFLDHYHRLHGFIALHQMQYEPTNATVAADAPSDVLGDIADPSAADAQASDAA